MCLKSTNNVTRVCSWKLCVFACLLIDKTKLNMIDWLCERIFIMCVCVCIVFSCATATVLVANQPISCQFACAAQCLFRFDVNIFWALTQIRLSSTTAEQHSPKEVKMKMIILRHFCRVNRVCVWIKFQTSTFKQSMSGNKRTKNVLEDYYASSTIAMFCS